jgi:hypothetical protein
VTSA